MRLLAQVERVEADPAGRRGTVAGTLTIAAFATVARGMLPYALSAQRAEHPGLTVRLSEMEPSEAIPALCQANVGIAVVQDWTDTPLELPEGLSGKHLLDDGLDVAVPARHRHAARHGGLTLAELAGEDWITWTTGQICHDWLSAALRDHGRPPIIAHTASEHSTQLALVAAGMGIAMSTGCSSGMGRTGSPHVRPRLPDRYCAARQPAPSRTRYTSHATQCRTTSSPPSTRPASAVVETSSAACSARRPVPDRHPPGAQHETGSATYDTAADGNSSTPAGTGPPSRRTSAAARATVGSHQPCSRPIASPRRLKYRHADDQFRARGLRSHRVNVQ